MPIRLDYSGYGPAAPALIRTRELDLRAYVTQLRHVVEEGGYGVSEASINASSDEELLEAVEGVCRELVSDSLRYVFLVGIGGSNLGTEAVYDALFHARDMVPHAAPRLVTLDANNPATLAGVEAIIKTITTKAEFVVVAVSKSGGTTETIANTEILLALLTTQCGSAVADRVVIVSDEGSPFFQAGQTARMHTFALPPVIGGRYSVFTAVGMVPLALLGIPVRELLAGAEAAVSAGVQSDFIQNEAAALAVVVQDAYKRGLFIHNAFFFASELETLGKWWRQLVGESLGKTTIDGERTVGITPTVAIGSTDLHSMGQLYLGGPKQTFTLFVGVETSREYVVPTERTFGALVPMITGKTVKDIQDAILEGTKTAYRERERLYVEWRMPEASAFELGYFMQTMMITTMLVGKLLQVNPFDQPDVEVYKKVTKQLLES